MFSRVTGDVVNCTGTAAPSAGSGSSAYDIVLYSSNRDFLPIVNSLLLSASATSALGNASLDAAVVVYFVSVASMSPALNVAWEFGVAPAAVAGSTVRFNASLQWRSSPDSVVAVDGSVVAPRAYRLAVASASATLDSPHLSSARVLINGEQTTPSRARVGDLVTLQLIVQIPEGTSPINTLVVALPMAPVMEFVSSR
jgi:hypothetical protein